MDKNRIEMTYRDTTQKNGNFSPKLGKQVASRVIRYCKRTNQNKTKFVEDCVSKALDELEKDMLSQLSKEELIQMIMNEKEN